MTGMQPIKPKEHTDSLASVPSSDLKKSYLSRESVSKSEGVVKRSAKLFADSAKHLLKRMVSSRVFNPNKKGQKKLLKEEITQWSQKLSKVHNPTSRQKAFSAQLNEIKQQVAGPKKTSEIKKLLAEVKAGAQEAFPARPLPMLPQRPPPPVPTAPASAASSGPSSQRIQAARGVVSQNMESMKKEVLQQLNEMHRAGVLYKIPRKEGKTHGDVDAAVERISQKLEGAPSLAFLIQQKQRLDKAQAQYGESTPLAKNPSTPLQE